ncbi:MAG: DNA mismatch repair protein MutS [Oscillospiraceae bacterium]|nr:DNA mismatch repair protein MutS [Ruminococcus sp.]MBP1566107.1 DNA mismatch repair protein MutS [Oscillospiraceae bacterium]MBQ9981005.1 DNA mismatch repair protein MutS [Oscillospiraceae bacterium]
MKTISIDLHNMPLTQAQREMMKILKTSPKDTTMIEVIHGCHHGDRILRYIRTELKHPRISKKILGLNNGITILELK